MNKIISFSDDICHQERDSMIERYLFGTEFDFSFREYSSWEGIGWISNRMNQLGYEITLAYANGIWTCYFNKSKCIANTSAEGKHPWDAVIACSLSIIKPKNNEANY